jgi:DUF971 family protein
MHIVPIRINFDRPTNMLIIQWTEEIEHSLSAEFLRVHSPSAEVRGHGVGQEILQVGKRNVSISQLENAGRYALKITFDDGHDSGLFDWTYLRKLGDHQEPMWQDYLTKLEQSGQSRDSNFINVTQL